MSSSNKIGLGKFYFGQKKWSYRQGKEYYDYSMDGIEFLKSIGYFGPGPIIVIQKIDKWLQWGGIQKKGHSFHPLELFEYNPYNGDQMHITFDFKWNYLLNQSVKKWRGGHIDVEIYNTWYNTYEYFSLPIRWCDDTHENWKHLYDEATI